MEENSGAGERRWEDRVAKDKDVVGGERKSVISEPLKIENRFPMTLRVCCLLLILVAIGKRRFSNARRLHEYR